MFLVSPMFEWICNVIELVPTINLAACAFFGGVAVEIVVMMISRTYRRPHQDLLALLEIFIIALSPMLYWPGRNPVTFDSSCAMIGKVWLWDLGIIHGRFAVAFFEGIYRKARYEG